MPTAAELIIDTDKYGLEDVCFTNEIHENKIQIMADVIKQSQYIEGAIYLPAFAKYFYYSNIDDLFKFVDENAIEVKEVLFKDVPLCFFMLVKHDITMNQIPDILKNHKRFINKEIIIYTTDDGYEVIVPGVGFASRYSLGEFIKKIVSLKEIKRIVRNIQNSVSSFVPCSYIKSKKANSDIVYFGEIGSSSSNIQVFRDQEFARIRRLSMRQNKSKLFDGEFVSHVTYEIMSNWLGDHDVKLSELIFDNVVFNININNGMYKIESSLHDCIICGEHKMSEYKLSNFITGKGEIYCPTSEMYIEVDLTNDDVVMPMHKEFFGIDIVDEITTNLAKITFMIGHPSESEMKIFLDGAKKRGCKVMMTFGYNDLKCPDVTESPTLLVIKDIYSIISSLSKRLNHDGSGTSKRIMNVIRSASMIIFVIDIMTKTLLDFVSPLVVDIEKNVQIINPRMIVDGNESVKFHGSIKRFENVKMKKFSNYVDIVESFNYNAGQNKKIFVISNSSSALSNFFYTTDDVEVCHLPDAMESNGIVQMIYDYNIFSTASLSLIRALRDENIKIDKLYVIIEENPAFQIQAMRFLDMILSIDMNEIFLWHRESRLCEKKGKIPVKPEKPYDNVFNFVMFTEHLLAKEKINSIVNKFERINYFMMSMGGKVLTVPRCFSAN